MKYLFCMICLICLCCCQNQNSNINNHFEGENILITDPVNISVEDLIDLGDLDTIRLEVTDQSLLKDIEHLLIMDNRLYIKDRNSIFIFTSDGHFISKIDTRGRGPKEYIGIINFSLDYLHHKIILIDHFSSKILTYSADGIFEQAITLNFKPLNIIPYYSGYIHFRSGSQEHNTGKDKRMETYSIHFMDSIGQIVSFALPDETPLNIQILSPVDVCYSVEGNILYQPVLCDTIYEINKTGVYPLYVFENQSKYTLMSTRQKRRFTYTNSSNNNELKNKEQQGYLLPWGYILDTDDYFFCQFTGWDYPINLFYSKPEKHSVTVDIRNIKGNDLFKSIFTESSPRAAHKNYFYISPSFSPDFDLQKFDDMPDGKLKEYLKNTNWEDANPLLIGYKLNNHLF